ncbi:MAG: hypothetical protein JSV61_10585 [Anaerolineales bacterium]|nr:MAG: hypothetical protein JSV61_10585 [Anaerolineales bacterium]
MSKLDVEINSVQKTIMLYAVESGWKYPNLEDALNLRYGDGQGAAIYVASGLVRPGGAALAAAGRSRQAGDYPGNDGFRQGW